MPRPPSEMPPEMPLARPEGDPVERHREAREEQRAEELHQALALRRQREQPAGEDEGESCRRVHEIVGRRRVACSERRMRTDGESEQPHSGAGGADVELGAWGKRPRRGVGRFARREQAREHQQDDARRCGAGDECGVGSHARARVRHVRRCEHGVSRLRGVVAHVEPSAAVMLLEPRPHRGELASTARTAGRERRGALLPVRVVAHAIA